MVRGALAVGGGVGEGGVKTKLGVAVPGATVKEIGFGAPWPNPNAE
jgi:hypothetical protein